LNVPDLPKFRHAASTIPIPFHSIELERESARIPERLPRLLVRLYEAATDEERADLLRLLIARIDFHSKNASVVVTFRDDVKLTAPVRSYAVKWLHAPASDRTWHFVAPFMANPELEPLPEATVSPSRGSSRTGAVWRRMARVDGRVAAA
jgi:hypothetical protein